jgi:HEPN domain-containing protein
MGKGDKKEEWVEISGERKEEFLKSFIDGAGEKLEEAKRKLKGYLPNYSEIVCRSRECIEFSIKAVFLLLLGKYPKEHRITRSEFREIIKKVDEMPADQRKDLLPWIGEEFPRLYLYSEFWQRFHTVAEYGDEELGFPREKLFGEKEAAFAVEHAERCKELAFKLWNYFKYTLKK